VATPGQPGQPDHAGAAGALAVRAWVRVLAVHKGALAAIRDDLEGEITMPRFDLLANLVRSDGQTLASPPRGASGHPDQPLTDAQLRDKFLGCAAPVLGSDGSEALADQVAHLEDVPDVRALTSRLVGPRES